MTLTLDRLELRGFKGAAHTEIHLGGQTAAIYGDNATGKTTLHDAWTWLLFDKDASGSAAFAIKTIEPDGTPASGAEHAVTARVLRDGQPMELSKIYAEKWVKRRGSSDRELAGHETRYYLDGVPVTKRAYDDAVAEIAPADWFRVLSDPQVFSGALPWRDRRKILVDAFGAIDDDALTAAHPELAELHAARGRHSVDDHRKIVDETRKRLNRDRAAIPARIDEATRLTADAPDADAAQAAVAATAERTREARELLAAAKASDPKARLRAEAREAQAKADDLKAAAERDRDRRAFAAAQRVERLTERERDAINARERAADHLRAQLDRAEDAERATAEIRARYQAARAETYQPTATAPEACPACGQPLPASAVAEAAAAAAAAWRTAQARKLERALAEGREAAAQAKAARAAATEAETRAVEAAAAAEAIAAERAEAIAEHQAIKAEPLTVPPEAQALADRVRLLNAQAGAEPDAVDVRSETEALAAAEAEHALALQALANAHAAAKARERIDELKADERRLSAELIEAERQIGLCERYTRYRVAALEDAINARFHLARFRLFEDQINGGLAEVCETTYAGVPWGSLNHGTRVNVGLDIIDTLARHRGFTPPVWIDNAESITTINPTIGQQIRLVVSRDDQALRIETETTA